MPARAEADRRPDLGGRPLAHALLDLRHGRVRRLHAREPLSSTTTFAPRCARCSARSRTATFAREWIAEMDSGEHNFDELRAAARERQIEQVGRELRSLMTRKQPTRRPWRRLTSPSHSSATARSAARSAGCWPRAREDIERATGHRLRRRARARPRRRRRSASSRPSDGVLTTDFAAIRDDPSIARRRGGDGRPRRRRATTSCELLRAGQAGRDREQAAARAARRRALRRRSRRRASSSASRRRSAPRSR